MAFEPWGVVDVTAWERVQADPRGLRAKSWVQSPDGDTWLRKEPRPSRPSEVAIEVAMLRLAREVGLEAPACHPCTWLEGTAQRRGIVVKRFLMPPEETLVSGAAILSGVDPTYDPKCKEQHTFVRVEEALRRIEEGESCSLLERFVEILLFDAWTGNGDRHPENWGIIRAPSGPPRLAPLYDPACCLGTELLDDHRLLDASRTIEGLNRYIERCPSGFGDGHKLIRNSTLVTELKKTSVCKTRSGTFLANCARAQNDIISFVEQLPDDWLSESRRALAVDLLRERAVWLLERL